MDFIDDNPGGRVYNEMSMNPIVKIHIGELYATQKPTIICTLLGSCVSTCLYDPEAGVGGMNHILSVNKPRIDPNSNSARYGVHAMEQLINEMIKLGAQRQRIHAKVFGGGNMLKMSKANSPGPLNVAFALNYLKEEKIRLVAQNTGGPFSRKLFFNTANFEARLRRRTVRSSAELESESTLEIINVKSIANKAGEITLFD